MFCLKNRYGFNPYCPALWNIQRRNMWCHMSQSEGDPCLTMTMLKCSNLIKMFTCISIKMIIASTWLVQ